MAAEHPAAEFGPKDLLGAWQLESWQIFSGEEQEPGLPFGAHPAGLLLYSADGWMSATVHRTDRPQFPAGRSPRRIDPADVAGAYWSYFHYAGTWRLAGDRVIHTVRHSLNPNMGGSEQVRQIKLFGNLLSLTGVELINGLSRRHELVWRRHERWGASDQLCAGRVSAAKAADRPERAA